MRATAMALATVALWTGSASAEQLDSEYGSAGRYVEQEVGRRVSALAMRELADGSIVQVSSMAPGPGCTDAACLRISYLSASGVLRITELPHGSPFESLAGAAVDSRGRIIVAGTGTPTVGGRNFLVARYQPGSPAQLDTSFGSNGRAEVDFFGFDDQTRAIAVDGNDNIVVVGDAGRTGGEIDFGAARLRAADGAPDTSFSGDGKTHVFFDLGATQRWDSPHALEIADSGGQITVVGTAFDSTTSRYRVAMARFTRDGEADNSLCSQSCGAQSGYPSVFWGRRIHAFGGNTQQNDAAYGVTRRGDGGFYVVGDSASADGANRRGVISQFSSVGTLLNEVFNDGQTGQSSFRAVRLSDAEAQRVIVAGTTGAANNILMIQAYNANLVPEAGYGTCLSASAICFAGSSSGSDAGPNRTVSLNMDRRGRLLFAGSFVATSGAVERAIFARVTNFTAPYPDLIFRQGF